MGLLSSTYFPLEHRAGGAQSRQPALSPGPASGACSSAGRWRPRWTAWACWRGSCSPSWLPLDCGCCATACWATRPATKRKVRCRYRPCQHPIVRPTYRHPDRRSTVRRDRVSPATRYMKTPHIDRLATEGAIFQNAFHPRPSAREPGLHRDRSYASRHGSSTKSAGRAESPASQLPSSSAAAGYRPRTSANGTWATRSPPPGLRHLDQLPAARGRRGSRAVGRGEERPVRATSPICLGARPFDFVDRARARPFALFLSHKAVHKDGSSSIRTLDMSKMRG